MRLKTFRPLSGSSLALRCSTIVPTVEDSMSRGGETPSTVTLSEADPSIISKFTSSASCT